MWFTIAVRNDIRVAEKYGSRLKIKMSDNDIEYAINQANDWINLNFR